MYSAENNWENYCSEFIQKIDPLSARFKIRPRGIWTSELFALYAFSQEFGIEHYIESGLGNSQSFTNMTILLDYSVWLTGIDIEKKNWMFGSNFRIGDGNELVLDEVEKHTNKSTGIFLDGPKGIAALNLALKCLPHDHVAFVALHDTPKHTGVRTAIEKLDEYKHWSTDDYGFVEQYKILDNNRWAEHLPEDRASGHLPYLNVRTGKHCPSYGPTLTVIYKD